jgi:hypothetical protein
VGSIAVDPKVARDWLDTVDRARSADADDSVLVLSSPAQPWAELARVYEDNGQPVDARRLRYAWARRANRHSPPAATLVQTLYRITSGYGHYPFLALAWLVLLFVAAFTITSVAHDDFTTPTTRVIADHEFPGAEASGAPGRVTAGLCENPEWDTSCLNSIEYAFGVTLAPAIKASAWEPPPGPTAYILHAFRTLSWIFVGFLLAGLTGLLRKA